MLLVSEKKKKSEIKALMSTEQISPNLNILSDNLKVDKETNTCRLLSQFYDFSIFFFLFLNKYLWL